MKKLIFLFLIISTPLFSQINLGVNKTIYSKGLGATVGYNNQIFLSYDKKIYHDLTFDKISMMVGVYEYKNNYTLTGISYSFFPKNYPEKLKKLTFEFGGIAYFEKIKTGVGGVFDFVNGEFKLILTINLFSDGINKKTKK